jgi:hypothetical protein
MADDYEILIDPEVGSGDAVRLEVPAGLPLGETATAVDAVLAADDAHNRIVLVVGGRSIGVTSRSYLVENFGPAQTRALGDAERATQPGESTRYRVIAFRCAQCGRQAYTAFYDVRFHPVCDVAGHGAMDRS